MSNILTEPTRFEGTFVKPVLAQFDAARRTSDAGLMLLGALDRKLGFTEQLGSELEDLRDPNRVIHSIEELFRQRIDSIALGAPDCNDAAHLRSDPALLLACGRSTTDGSNLGSQPTLSRFEHQVTGRELVRLQHRIEAFAVKRLSKKRKLRKRITIVLDPSVNPTQGQQLFAYFNGFYDSWCYLPMFGFLSIEGEADQYLCGSPVPLVGALGASS